MSLAFSQRKYDQQNGIDEKRPTYYRTEVCLYDFSSTYVGGLPALSKSQKAIYAELADCGHYGTGAPEYVACFWDSAKLGICDASERTGNRETFTYKIDAWDRQNYPQLRDVETLTIWRTIGDRTGYGFRVDRIKCVACKNADCSCEV